MRPLHLLRGLALALALAAPGAGPARAETRPVDAWPLWVADPRPVAGIRADRIGGPLFERWEVAPGAPAYGAEGWDAVWSLRPLAAGLREEADEGLRVNLELLHPLAELRRRPDRTSLRLSPLADRTRDEEPRGEGEEERDRWTFLLAFGGRTGAGEGYGGLFPLLGTAKQRFGKERIDFVLFPLWGRSRDRHGFVRHHVLWPFFSFGKGGGRKMWRFWPFYGQDLRDEEWDRRFALWPIFHWRTERLGQPHERRTRLVLPLYGETRSAHARSRFVLGPLYMSSSNDLTGARSLDLVWPLFRRAETPPREGFAGSGELKIEPFYRDRHGPGYQRRSHVFGIWDRIRAEQEGVRHESTRVLFVNRFERSTVVETGDFRVRRDLWPLFSFRDRGWHDEAEASRRAGRLYVPWLLPLGGEGFQRNLAGLLTLHERRWLDEERRHDTLWGLARHRRADGYRLDAVSWLGRRERLGDEGTRWRLLGVPLPLP